MSWFGKLFFPHEQPDERRRKVRVLYMVIFGGLLVAAILAAGLYLLNKPLRK